MASRRGAGVRNASSYLSSRELMFSAVLAAQRRSSTAAHLLFCRGSTGQFLFVFFVPFSWLIKNQSNAHIGKKLLNISVWFLNVSV
jgi:hypothetical protein